MSDKIKSVWSFFASVKLAIALLIIISLASILGTIIPQQDAAQTLSGRLSPGMMSFFGKLQLFDIFHSIWFVSLLVLLAVNLVVCSLNRLPASWKRVHAAFTPDDPEIFKDLPANQVILTEETREEETARIENLLKKRFKKVTRKDTDHASFLAGEKGNYSSFGVYLIHASVLVILAGTIIGFLLGFNAYVEIAEGESANAVRIRGGKELKKLDFTVRCDRFIIDYYEDGTPKLYQSDISFLRNGALLYKTPVRVNHPAIFEGMWFYQAHYGRAPSGEAVIMLRKGREKAHVINVGMGKEFELPGKEGKASVIRMEANLMRMGPAVKINIETARDNIQFWVFQNIEQIEEENPGVTDHVPMFNPGAFAPYVFSLATIHTKYFTGLQVARDPGVPVVVAGSLLLVAGFMTVFFYAHRRIWIRIDGEGTHTRISITGKTNKDPVGFHREFSRLIQEIKKAEEKRS